MKKCTHIIYDKNDHMCKILVDNNGACTHCGKHLNKFHFIKLFYLNIKIFMFIKSHDMISSSNNLNDDIIKLCGNKINKGCDNYE